MAARLSDRIAGAILFALAIWYWFTAGDYTIAFGDPAGPSLFPRIVAFPLGLFALFLVIRPDPNPEWFRWPQALGQIGTIIALLVYPFILEPLGFPLSTMLISVVLSKILGGSWLQSVLCGIAIGLGLYVLFNFGFDLPLPVGPIFG